MVKLRLQRVGRKNDPSFRLVATDSHNGPQSGRFIEILGSHDSRKDNTQIKGERVKYWISQGAQVSSTVHNLLISQKIIEGKKINVLPKKSPIKKEPTGAELKAEQEAKTKAEAKEETKSEEASAPVESETPEVKEEVVAEEPAKEEPAPTETPATPAETPTETPAEETKE